MPTLPFAETVTIVRQTVDAYGDHTAGASHYQAGCAVWPTTGKETIVGGMDVVVFGFTVLMPADADILPTDQVILRGITYDVDGEPALYMSPLTGTQSGIEVHLTTATG